MNKSVLLILAPLLIVSVHCKGMPVMMGNFRKYKSHDRLYSELFKGHFPVTQVETDENHNSKYRPIGKYILRDDNKSKFIEDCEHLGVPDAGFVARASGNKGPFRFYLYWALRGLDSNGGGSPDTKGYLSILNYLNHTHKTLDYKLTSPYSTSNMIFIK
jgi:hypothetical protein